ncbi:hypothetical protein CHUAL_014044 [Chamberlinius hualienensis]
MKKFTKEIFSSGLKRKYMGVPTDTISNHEYTYRQHNKNITHKFQCLMIRPPSIHPFKSDIFSSSCIAVAGFRCKTTSGIFLHYRTI